MDKTPTLQKAGVKERNICYVLIGLFLLSLIPLLVISFYNVPLGDDYRFSIGTHAAWQNTHSIGEVFKAAAQQVHDTYFEWQGTFSAIFLFALQPALFHENLYFLTTFIMLGMLIGGTFFFYKVVFRNYLKTNRFTMIIITIVTLVPTIQFLPSAVEGFYWYNGSLYYTFFHGLMLFAMGLVLLNLKEQKIYLRVIYTVLSCIFAIILGRSNFVTALTTCVILCTMMGYCLIDKKRRKKISMWISLCIPFILATIAFMISILAPGNDVRQSALEKYNPIKAIIESFRYMIYSIGIWTIVPVIIALLFLIPFFVKIARDSTFSFKYPLVISILSVGLLTAMFCPPFYAMRSEGAVRLVNIVFYSFILLLVLNVLYYTGWLVRRYETYSEKHNDTSQSFIKDILSYFKKHAVIGVTSVLILFAISTIAISGTTIPGNPASTISATKSLLNGEAKQYKEQAEERLKLYQDPNIKDVRVPEFKSKPPIIYTGDITEDINNYINIAVAGYYNKDSVALENPS